MKTAVATFLINIADQEKAAFIEKSFSEFMEKNNLTAGVASVSQTDVLAGTTVIIVKHEVVFSLKS